MTTRGATVELRGARELQRRLGRRRFMRALMDAGDEIGGHTAGEIAEVTPVGQEPPRGGLAAAWTHRVQQRGNSVEITVGNAKFYGPFVNFGTGIYVGRGRIRPKRAKALRFRIAGRVIFRKSVRGQRGQHFVERGFNNARPPIPRIVTAILERAIGRA